MSNTFSEVLVYDQLAGVVRLLKNGTGIYVADGATGLPVTGLTQNGTPVSTISSDAMGKADFVCDSAWVTLTSPSGLSQDVVSQSALIAAAGAGASSDAAVAALITSSSSTRTAGDARWVRQIGNVLDDGSANHAAFFGNPAGHQTRVVSGDNTGLGYFVLKNGTYTGTGTVAVGAVAGMAATTGANLTFVGYYAGGAVTTASEVTYVGSYAGFQNTGSLNTGIGSRALCGPNLNIPAATGSNNTAVGKEALATISSGGNNTAVGVLAGGGAGPLIPISNVTFSGTTITLTLADTGGLAVGSTILMAGITGFTTNNPNGTRTIASIPDSTHLTYVVPSAPTGTYGSGGTVLGGSMTASNCTYIGYSAGLNNQRGQGNTAIGANALITADVGGANTASGYSALNKQTTAANNVANGYQAGFSVTTGGNNVFIGKDAGLTATVGNATTTGTNQTVIGYQAGLGSSVQANHIVAIGSSTLADGAFAVSLGHAAYANGAGSVAIGCDSGGAGAQAAAANSFVLGTANHRYKMPGLPTANPGAGTGILWNNGGVVTVA